MQQNLDVLIVGGGSRALLVLERLIHSETFRRARPTRILIAEPGELGPGIHLTNQANYIRFNTETSCPTIFSNGKCTRSPSTAGPSLEEWLRAKSDAPLEELLPRSVVGEYLKWAAHHLMSNLPCNFEVSHLRESIVDVSWDSGALVFQTESGLQLRPCATVLAVGHAIASDIGDITQPGNVLAERIIVDVFPTHLKLSQIKPKDVVAIRGIGLTAMDVVAELTIGRGGKFVVEADTRSGRYIPSGAEPRLYLFSRTGCPLRSRSQQVMECAQDRGLTFLTPERSARLQHMGRTLSFRTEVYPFVLAEIATRLSAIGRGSPHRQQFCRFDPSDRTDEEVRDYFNSYEAQQAFNQILRPRIKGTLTRSSRLAARFIIGDAEEFLVSPQPSPLKNALNVLLEARNFVKSLVDYGRCSLSDPDWIYGEFSSIVNRNVIGPDLARNLELVSLIDAGVVQVAPSDTRLHLQNGRIALLLPDEGGEVAVDFAIAADRPTSASPIQRALLDKLFSSGFARPVLTREGRWAGLQVDADMRALPVVEGVLPSLWAIGPLCEGSSYYNNYVPCLRDDATFPFREAERLVDALAPVVLSCNARG